MQMHRTILGMILLGFIGASALFYTGWAGWKLYKYSVLTYRIPVDSIEWKTDKQDEDQIAVDAYYTFSLGKNHYSGKDTWHEVYLNEWAGQEAVRRLSAQSWKVWFNPNDPNYSTLQKKFPYKQCISAAVLWMLFIYFIGLSRYIERR